MSTLHTTSIVGFPLSRLTLAREALARSYRAIVRAAARANQAAPSEPTLAITRAAYWESICVTCHVRWADLIGGTCMACRKGVCVSRQILDLELHWERPVLAGWEFLAVVEPLIGGNLIRRVPHAVVAEGELARWERGGITCDHCNTLRSRLETFIVRADGSDPAIPAGTYKQVGRNCLSAFLGGLSPAAILASIGWASMIRSEAGEDSEGGWPQGDEAHEIVEFMAWVASSARLNGFVTKGAAQKNPDGPGSTASHVDYLLTPQRGGEALSLWLAARAIHQPTDADRARGVAALAWARGLAGGSDYERNLRLIVDQPALGPKHMGLAASAIAGYDRATGQAVAAASKGSGSAHGAGSAHLGAVGDKGVAFGKVTIERIHVIETNYGALHIHSFRDAAGNVLVWKTSKGYGVAGDVVELKGTIKAHTEFRGEKQTELSRCKIANTGEGTTCEHGIMRVICLPCNVASREPVEQHPTSDDVTS